jgi:hypothetical protein
MRSVSVVTGLMVIFLASFRPGMTEETSHLAFVLEYVRQLGANERLREVSEKETSQAASGADKIMAGIRASTRIVLELNSQITSLNRIQLAEPFDTLPGNIATFYSMKVALHERLLEIDKIFLSAPNPNVDYGALTADAPKITANMEHIDRSLFEATPLIFATLIDEKADRSGHMSRLIVTKAERAKLVRDLTTSFGKKMEARTKTTSSARLLF